MQWVCNFCKHEGAVPPTYQCPLDAAGLRRDREQRAELCRGSVDFSVPKVSVVKAGFLLPGIACDGVSRFYGQT